MQVIQAQTEVVYVDPLGVMKVELHNVGRLWKQVAVEVASYHQEFLV